MKLANVVKALFENYSDGLQRFVSQKLGNVDDAQEIVQDTFHNYLRMDEAENIENPKAFLYKTAHNLALNHIRKRHYHTAYIESQDADAKTISLERVMASKNDVLTLQACLERLPSETRKIFLMNRMEGKSYNQIAQDLDLSIGQVQKHMVKTLNYLRKYLTVNAIDED